MKMAGLAVAACIAAATFAAPGAASASPTAIGTVDQSVDPTPDENGTTNLGTCDSFEAVTSGPTEAFVCLGSEATDFARLRDAYSQGGMAAVAREAKLQGSSAADVSNGSGSRIAAASGGTQLTGYSNKKNTITSWTFYATVIYGTIRTDGTITQYGQFFTRDDIRLRGNFADFTFNADRTVGSAMKFKLSNWFSITTGGGSWSSNSKTCAQTVYSGTVYSCNHSYSISGYVGNGFYGKSNVQWWNQYSPNPSSADGSWTLTESHGPMDCVSGRSQICQFR